MLMLLTKLCAVEMVGQFVFGLAITSPLMMFAGLSIRPVEATDARREYRFGEYLGLTTITSVLGMQENGGVVLEVNTTPGFYYHARGESCPAAVSLLEVLLRRSQLVPTGSKETATL